MKHFNSGSSGSEEIIRFGDPSAIGQSLINASDAASARSTIDAEQAFENGTTAQYFRGDKTWQSLNKSAVGLGNVDNTSDANKPISSAQQAEFNTKVDNASGQTLTLWKGTQSAYDALGSYDSNTIYVVSA